MSNLLITKDDIRKAVVTYFQDYESELYKKFDFESIDWYVDDKRSTAYRIEAIVSEKE